VEGAIVISGKALGQRRPLFADFSVPLPPSETGGDGGTTLRDLIERVVRHEVKSFKDRRERRKFVQVLSSRQIDEAVERGKVDMGGRDLEQKVDEDDAVATALQGFEDGLYLVILDGEEQRELDKQIYPKPDSRVTFVRLVFLAGA
jgi:hypothetical protein